MANADRYLLSVYISSDLAHKIEALYRLHVMNQDELVAHLLDIGFKNKPEGEALSAFPAVRPLKERSQNHDSTYKNIFVEKPLYDKIRAWQKGAGMDKDTAFSAVLGAGVAHTHLVSFEDQVKQKEEAYWKRTLGATLFKKMDTYANKKKTTLGMAADQLFLKAANKSNKEQVKALIEKGLAVK